MEFRLQLTIHNLSLSETTESCDRIMCSCEENQEEEAGFSGEVYGSS